MNGGDGSKWRGPRFWKRSLVARLVTYFVVLSLVTVVLLGTVSFLQARRALGQSVLGRLAVAAALKEDALVQWFAEQQNELHLLAELRSVEEGASDLLRHPESDPHKRPGYTTVDDVVSPLVASKPGWHEILLLSDGGKVLLSTEKEHEGQYRILDRYFTEGKSGPYVEKVYPSPVSYQPTLTFSMPLGEGPVGVLAMHLDLAHAHRIIAEREGLGENSRSYLVDRYQTPLSDHGFGWEGFRRGVRSRGIERALAGNDGQGPYDNYAGIPVLGVYRWIEEADVALLIEIPQNVAFAPAKRILLLVVAVGGSVVALLTLGTWFLARQIASPVLRITGAAVRVALGDLETRVPVVTEDEVGILARTFNRMTESLENEITERIRVQNEREVLIEELEAKNAELERFTYTVSHDLKSPLVTIRGFLGLLLRDIRSGKTEKVAKDVDHILRASDTMSQILEDLLELSRAGHQQNPPEEVDLDALVRQALASVEGPLCEAGVEVAVRPGMGTAHGDRLRLHEVFQNLIENAVRFMGDQPNPRIEIGAEADGVRILCHVRDNGIGIDPRHQERVFGLFERLDAATEGTGIGLALVKRIVEFHGGRIRIESPGRKGEGTTFYFTLPSPEKELCS